MHAQIFDLVSYVGPQLTLIDLTVVTSQVQNHMQACNVHKSYYVII